MKGAAACVDIASTILLMMFADAFRNNFPRVCSPDSVTFASSLSALGLETRLSSISYASNKALLLVASSSHTAHTNCTKPHRFNHPFRQGSPTQPLHSNFAKSLCDVVPETSYGSILNVNSMIRCFVDFCCGCLQKVVLQACCICPVIVMSSLRAEG